MLLLDVTIRDAVQYGNGGCTGLVCYDSCLSLGTLINHCGEV